MFYYFIALYIIAIYYRCVVIYIFHNLYTLNIKFMDLNLEVIILIEDNAYIIMDGIYIINCYSLPFPFSLI